MLLYIMNSLIETSCGEYHVSPIHVGQIYTHVNLFLCAIFSLGKQLVHANANTLWSKFTLE